MLPKWVKNVYLVVLAIIIAITCWALATPYPESNSNTLLTNTSVATNDTTIATYNKVLFACYIILIVLCVLAGIFMMLNMGKWRKIVFTIIIIFYIIITSFIVSISKLNKENTVLTTVSASVATGNVNGSGSSSSSSNNISMSSSSIGMLIVMWISFIFIICQYSSAPFILYMVRDILLYSR